VHFHIHIYTCVLHGTRRPDERGSKGSHLRPRDALLGEAFPDPIGDTPLETHGAISQSRLFADGEVVEDLKGREREGKGGQGRAREGNGG